MAWRRPKVGGGFCGPRNQRIDNECVITFAFVFGRPFCRLWGLLGRKASAAAGTRFGRSGSVEIMPALQQEHDCKLTQAKTHFPEIRFVKNNTRRGAGYPLDVIRRERERERILVFML
eukprot:4152422-Pyramimonas_sp.AAC.1